MLKCSIYILNILYLSTCCLYRSRWNRSLFAFPGPPVSLYRKSQRPFPGKMNPKNTNFIIIPDTNPPITISSYFIFTSLTAQPHQSNLVDLTFQLANSSSIDRLLIDSTLSLIPSTASECSTCSRVQESANNVQRSKPIVRRIFDFV